MENNSQEATELLIELKDYESQTLITNSTRKKASSHSLFMYRNHK